MTNLKSKIINYLIQIINTNNLFLPEKTNNLLKVLFSQNKFKKFINIEIVA